MGVDIDQVQQLKQLQEENQRLKRLVAELMLDKTMLQDVLAKRSGSLRAAAGLHERGCSPPVRGAPFPCLAREA